MYKKPPARIYLLFIAIGLLLLAALTYWNYFNLFPTGLHAWPQSDHYALSIGFTENGLNFFLPETKVLNPEFPNFTPPADPKGITSVDFPLYHYISAVIMKITGSRAPAVNRFVVLLFALSGLFYLYRIAWKISGKQVVAVLSTLFAWTSPVYLYYQCNFLPSIPALALCIIGVYHYLNFRTNGSNTSVINSVLFLTLSSLVRTPFVLLMGCCLVHLLLSKNSNSKKIFTVGAFLIGLGAVASYFMYNLHVRNLHGSLFFGELLLPDSPLVYVSSFSDYFWRWKTHYLTKYHYVAFVAGLLLCIWKRKKIELNGADRSLLLLLALFFLAATGYSFAMLHAFRHHDYYFLDSFFLPFVFAMIFLLTKSALVLEKKRFIIYGTAGLIVALAMFSAYQNLTLRYADKSSKISEMTQAYRGFGDDLDTKHISRDARLLVLEAHAPNIPLLLAERKGYALQRVDDEFLENALEWDFDYITIEKVQAWPAIKRRYPWLISRLRLAYDNDHVLLFKKPEN